MCQCLEKYRIQQCCCGCTLRMGSIIIGIVELLTGVTNVIQSSVSGGPQMGGQIAAGIIEILINIALLYGVYKSSTFFILPWIILRAIGCVILLIAPIIILIIGLASAQYILLAFIPVFLIIAVIAIYFWLCVWSHYLELKEGGPAQPTV